MWELISVASVTSVWKPCSVLPLAPCSPTWYLIAGSLLMNYKPWVTKSINTCMENCKYISVNSLRMLLLCLVAVLSPLASYFS